MTQAVTDRRTPRGAAVVGVGSAVPERVVGNAEIAARLGVDEDWLHQRTGTRDRHVASPDDRLDLLAGRAARAALHRAGVDPAEVDTVLVGTTSAEDMSPHAAPLVAADIGASGAAAMDISAACPGFLSGLATGAGLVESGRAATVLVIGADMLSRYLDPDDRGSAMLFGDGAGAVVLRATGAPGNVGPTVLHSDGDGRDLIRLDREKQLITMDGPAVYRHAVQRMCEVTREVTERAGIAVTDIDLFVYHQANSRIIDAVGRRLKLASERVVDVVAGYANTSAASLPIALDAARRDGRLLPGARVLLAAFGAGMVWGGAVLTWGGTR